MIRWLLPLFLLALPALAEESIVSGLSQNRVSITADFDGSEILIYGAVKREAPVPKGSPLQVIITVEGPSTPVIVRRKDRVVGIWVNNAEVRVDSAPSFYAVATTGPLSDILSDTDNLRHRITIERAIRAVGITGEADQADAFVQAMLRVRSNEDRYRVLEGAVQLTDDTLFRTDVVLPSNLTEGEYTVRLFLLRDGRVVATQERAIRVRKEGLERFIFTMAHEQPLLYGLLSLVLAGIAGWAASAAFRLIR
ncbi:MAG: TIGR02186 family protein [Tabrizicola sp.]|uniref:TIGR02186 family protein n=1 Tax=Tabrizicola sp. TaxID=2005166 RepID=UPI0027324015|nr:TIGR02186 family protein [Tabrizicola sp.]MDP3264802.1 TIGR02186 family protein [Tabrizicola sp.]MDP3647537.1 TIGR02186 family protein [Paracoccaceae bacterium]MDZ4069102.1 TIGR02186 family protein [Tabrizicola sp.]